MRRLTWLVPMILAGVCNAQATAPKPRLALDTPAPDIKVSTLDEKPTSLAALRTTNPNKIIVLQFASLTDPIFRSHATSVDRLAARDLDKALFVIVYQKEFHAADSQDPLEINANEGFNIAEPTSLAERIKLAKQVPERLGIANQTIVVDAWNNAASLRYGSYPNMTFIIDAKGNLVAGYPFMDTTKVQTAIDTLAAGKPLPDALRGSTQGNTPAPFDPSTAAMDMTGGRGPAAIAAVLDHVSIPDAQRATLLAAVAGYLADVQAFRQARLGGVLPARGGAAAGTAATVPAKPPTVQDFQQSIADLRAGAEKVKQVIKQTLNAKDAAQLFSALDNLTPAQHLFSQ